MLRALIFDMDGLMVDTEPLYWQVARELAARHGMNVPDATLRRMMGRARIDAMRIFASECGINAKPDQLLAEREAMMLDRYATGVEPMPGLREVLARFHGRLKLAVATGSPAKFTDVLLPVLLLDRFFDVVQTGDDISRGKPDPEIYLRCMSRLGVGPAECIVLEDSHAGALAGVRAGACVIAVPSALTAEEDFSFAHARCANLAEAAETVENICRRGWPG